MSKNQDPNNTINRTTLWRYKKARLSKLKTSSCKIENHPISTEEFEEVHNDFVNQQEKISIKSEIAKFQNLPTQELNTIQETNPREKNLPHQEYPLVLCSTANVNSTADGEFMRCLYDLIEENIDNVDEMDENTSKATVSSAKTFNEILKIKNFHNPITQPVTTNPARILLDILKFCIKNNVSFSGTAELMAMVNNIFPEAILPVSKYALSNIFNPKDSIEYHIECTECYKYIKMLDNKSSSISCPNCKMNVNLKQVSSLKFFTIINPQKQIEFYLSKYEEYHNIVVNKGVTENGRLKDIYDGKCYKSLIEKLVVNENTTYVTVMFNTDGAPCFKSSQFSVWPIHLIINELPPQQRLKYTITCGLWFGKQKPNMRVFLVEFVNCMNQLSDGIECNINGKLKTVKVFTSVCCVDTIARAPMQGTVQFNGKFGCDWCYHSGKYFQGSMRYNVVNPHPEMRSHDSMIKHMIDLSEVKGPLYGVKHVSPLVNLYKFEIVKGFVPDYMHNIAEGVSKQITQNILNFLMKDDIDKINYYLVRIKIPFQIGRRTRSLEDKEFWKAKEYENWLLYYAIPILTPLVQKKYLKHLALLVDSLHILLKADIKLQEIEEVNEMLHQFVFDTEDLYGVVAMTYNVHQLLHIAGSVADWGPLWAHSTYAFENGNRILLNAIHCSKGVIQQIVRYLYMKSCIDILEKDIFDNQNYRSAQDKVLRSVKINDIQYFGEYIIDNDLLLTFQLQGDNIKDYKKIIKHGCLYSAYTKENEKSDNSYALLLNGMYIRIYTFLLDTEKQQQITLCHIIETVKNQYSETLRDVEYVNNKFSIVNTDEICAICVYMSIECKQYICAVPNVLHY